MTKYKIHIVILAILVILVLLVTSPRLLLYAYFAFPMVLSLFLPGYVALSIFSDFSRDERIVSSFAITIPVYALIAVTSSAFGLSNFFVSIFLIAAVLSSIYYFIKKKMYLDVIQGDKEGFSVFLILFVLTLLFVSLPYAGEYKISPDPYPIPDRYDSFNLKIMNLKHSSAIDNYVPYRQAQFIVDRLDIRTVGFIKIWFVNFFQRTPLMGFVTAFFFQSTDTSVPTELLWAVPPYEQGISYQLFQIIGSFLNSLLLFSGYLFLKELFNKKIALISMLFLLFSQFIFFNTFYTWPKSFAGYFILLSFYFLFQKKENRVLFAGFLAGLAYWAHDLSVIYILGGLVYLTINKKAYDAIKFSFTVIIMIIPWFAIGHFIYGESSLFFYYPFSTGGMPPAIHPESVIKVFFSTPIQNLIWIRVETAYFLLVPFYLYEYYTNSYIDIISGYGTIPGAIGIFLFLFTYYSLAKNFNAFRKEIISFIFIPLITIIVYQGWPRGIVASHFAESMIPIFIGFAVSVIINNKKILISLFSLSLLQYFALLGLSYGGNPLTWISSIGDCIVTVLLCLFYSAIIIVAVKKIQIT